MPQPLFFNEIKFIPSVEIAIHRGIWSFSFIMVIIILNQRFIEFINIFKSYKNIFILSCSSVLISINWTGFIYAVSINRVQDASMGYFISPVISIALGYFFLKEKISNLKIISITMMIIAIIFLIISSKTVPILALIIATTWGIYGLLRKKINIKPEIGLLFESGFIALLGLPYLIYLNFLGIDYFFNGTSKATSFLVLTGIITVFPLFFFNLGIRYITLGLAGVIFYIAPSFHFLTSILILNENVSINKLTAFIIIWIAIIIFIWDILKEEKKSTRIKLDY